MLAHDLLQLLAFLICLSRRLLERYRLSPIVESILFIMEQSFS